MECVDPVNFALGQTSLQDFVKARELIVKSEQVKASFFKKKMAASELLVIF